MQIGCDINMSMVAQKTNKATYTASKVKGKEDKNFWYLILCTTESGMSLCDQGKWLGRKVELVQPGVDVCVWSVDWDHWWWLGSLVFDDIDNFDNWACSFGVILVQLLWTMILKANVVAQ